MCHGGNCSCVRVAVKDDARLKRAMLLSMQLLKKVNDQLTLQILSDLLDAGGIVYRVDGAGMNSLMPLPGLIEARVLVAESDMEEARAILADIESDEEGQDV